MRRIIWNIITVLAALNLIWLFVFNYKLPKLSSFSSNKEEEAVSNEETGEELTADENGEFETAEQTEQNDEEGQQEEAVAAGDREEITEAASEEETEDQENTDDGLSRCRINDGYNARIRSGPGTDYEIVTEMESGSVLIITGELENGWYPIRTEDGTEGYIYSELVTVVESEE